MPSFPFSQALTANQLGFNPLANAGWMYEWLPWPARVNLLIRSTTVNTRVTLYSGAETIVERAPIQGGGTAGTTPSPLNTTPIDWTGAAGDRLKIVIDEVAGGTPTVDGLIQIDPAY